MQSTCHFRKLCEKGWEWVWYRTCLLISAPAWSNHNKHSGWPPKAAMWVGVCANLEVTAFTPQPTWTRRITQSSCEDTSAMHIKSDRPITCILRQGRYRQVCYSSRKRAKMKRSYVGWLGFRGTIIKALPRGMNPVFVQTWGLFFSNVQFVKQVLPRVFFILKRFIKNESLAPGVGLKAVWITALFSRKPATVREATSNLTNCSLANICGSCNARISC